MFRYAVIYMQLVCNLWFFLWCMHSVYRYSLFFQTMLRYADRFFTLHFSCVRSNLCNIWRYSLWSATYVIYGGIYSGNLWPAQHATCLKSKQQIVHRFFFWNINFCTSDLHFFVFSVNLIQHASCNFPIFFFHTPPYTKFY